ncbi:MAG: hypothetical protein ABIT38_14675 [Gemmatimonadaceae bacterium]
MVILRILHIVGGVFWVGAVLVSVLFLFKVVTDLGPLGGQMMGAFIKHRFFDAIPAAALVTILTGLDLFRRVSAGFDSAWMGSGRGITLSIGALAGLIAFVVGIFIGRPASMKAFALMERAGPMPDGPEKAALIAEAAPLRARGMGALRLAAALLVVATIGMAAAQYV